MYEYCSSEKDFKFWGSSSVKKFKPEEIDLWININPSYSRRSNTLVPTYVNVVVFLVNIKKTGNIIVLYEYI